MKKTVTLIGKTQYQTVWEYLNEVPDDVLHEVLIREHKSTISSRQQGYIFGVVYKAISAHTGYEKDELHTIYKKKFLIDIFLETPDEHQELVKRMEMVHELSKLGRAGYAKGFYAMVVDSCHLMDGKRGETANFIDRIIRHAAQEFNVSVPPPEPDILKR